MELANGKINKFFTPASESQNRYYTEDFDIETTKGLNNLFILTERIKNQSVVLDIGCGQGNFGKALHKRDCTVYGIEMDKQAAECARKTGCYKEVFVMDMTNKNTPEYHRLLSVVSSVDVIILSDVLEHLVDPTAALCQYAALLKEGGVVLVSVPNIAHMDIILNLINGRFNYSDMGILDNTHLKFFTKNSFVQWIAQINDHFKSIKFDCEYLGATFYENEYLHKIKTQYRELYSIFERCENHNGLQILFELKKINSKQEPKKLKSLLNETPNDVVEILGKTLKEICMDLPKIQLVEGERLFYEEKINLLHQQIDSHISNDKKNYEIIQKKNQYIDELEQNLQYHASKVRELNAALEGYQNAEIQAQQQLAAKDRYIEELEQNLQRHASKVRELNAALEGYQNAEIQKQEQIAAKDRYIEELEQNLQRHASKVKELNAALEGYQNAEIQKQEQLAAKDRYIEELEQNLQRHASQVRELNIALEGYQKSDAEKQSTILEKCEKISELEKYADENQHLKAKVSELQRQILSMENSFSWRITKFLRKD
jgi:O-antigen biosynthesis protein